jgi:cellulose synthase/poly-beta-1,6-N-acetylglucosamine synthase-like glycosyltransferase
MMLTIGDLLQNIFLMFYLLVLLLLCIYGAHRYHLVYLFHKYKSKHPVIPLNASEFPRVTIQVPVFNEQYVLERLLRSLCQLEYPRDRLEVQVLDDSTDETASIAKQIVDEMRNQQFNVHYLHRDDRQGYKAGALNAGLNVARGEFIAIFDADFVPDVQFLINTLPYFRDKRVGMVQARWGYLNRRYSLLTRLQAIYLDAHFIIEHLARNRSGRFFNFNGTAGIWRKDCLISAGGWESETLTEDLDISYRAQMAGWRFIFLPDVIAPSELPVEMNSFKLQQHRWAKGSIQTALKLLVPMLRSHHPWKVKLEAVFHLTNNVSYLLMIYLSLSMLPSMIIRFNMGWEETIWIDLVMLLVATAPVTAFYVTAEKALYKDWWARILYIPFLMSLGIGLALNNGIAVIEALFGISSEFKRTPKHGIEGASDSWKNKKYFEKLSFVTIAELLMSLYFTYAIYLAVVNRVYLGIPFLLLFQFGFSYVFLASVSQRISRFVSNISGSVTVAQSEIDAQNHNV